MKRKTQHIAEIRARHYPNVSRTALDDIKNNKSWKNI
jgi:hypothetical protein